MLARSLFLNRIESMMTTINEPLWAEHQYGVMANFIHHIAYWRCCSKEYQKSGIRSELWAKTSNAHLLLAVVNWCMVFGTDSNEIHWKKVVIDKADQNDFRRRLLADLEMTKREWDEYHGSMTLFRNTFAVHLSSNSPYPTLPMMDPAMRTAFSYDEWLRDKIDAVISEPTLQNRYHRLMRTSAEPFKKMIQIGPTIDEEYERHKEYDDSMENWAEN